MIKLVAIGNRLMKDDGVAIEVAKILEDRLSDLNIEIIIAETDCHNCFYLLDQEDFVLILDALYKGTEPGSIHIFKLEDVISQPCASFMQHDMSVIELMKLYGSKFKGYIIGIEVAEVGFGDKLSPVLKEKFQQICSKIETTIKEIVLGEIDYA
jgi:hydrogenase maturation protease